MITLTAIRKSIAKLLQDRLSGINVYHYIPDTPYMPCVIVVPSDDPTAELNSSMSKKGMTWHLKIFVLVQSTVAIENQEQLDMLLSRQSPDSVTAILWDNSVLTVRDNEDSPLGSVIVHCDSIQEYGYSMEIGGTPNFGAVINARVEI